MTAISSKLLQEEINKKNKLFWNELCGSQLAKQLGVDDFSIESLARFDKFYLNYYPYLEKYLFLDELKEKNTLEVGLGYGTVSQLLALAGANYHGLDITSNAVAMAAHRLKSHNLKGDVRVGSMIACPFQNNYFDYVISIGCFHHTGDLQACVDETYRILKTGGRATIMIYNKFSLRQWIMWPKITAKNLFLQISGEGKQLAHELQRKAYDSSSNGNGAPETEFFSIKEVKKIFRQFQSIKINRENFDEKFQIKLGKFPLYQFGDRLKYVNTHWARNFGLDLYIQVIK